MTTVLIFRDSDVKKDGKLKVKNNSKEMNENDFIKYIKDNNLTLSKGYIDIIGFISNGEKFKCSYNGFIIGVTGIIEKVKA